MTTYADRSQEKQNQSASTPVAKSKASGKSALQFVDNRPEAAQMRKMQEVANHYSSRQRLPTQKKENKTMITPGHSNVRQFTLTGGLIGAGIGGLIGSLGFLGGPLVGGLTTLAGGVVGGYIGHKVSDYMRQGTIANFHTVAMAAGAADLSHQIAWDSSTGQLANLRHIQTREAVAWGGGQTAQNAGLMIGGYAGAGNHNGLATVNARRGGNTDIHQIIGPFGPLALGYVGPPVAFTQNQQYEQSINGGPWALIPGSSYTITRTLTHNVGAGNRTFNLVKTNVANAGDTGAAALTI